jgi:hypothetical protein
LNDLESIGYLRGNSLGEATLSRDIDFQGSNNSHNMAVLF